MTFYVNVILVEFKKFSTWEQHGEENKSLCYNAPDLIFFFTVQYALSTWRRLIPD